MENQRPGAGTAATPDSDSSGRGQVPAQRAPWFFQGNIDNRRLGSFGWREDRQEDQFFGKWVVGAMNFSHGHEGDFARADNSILIGYPLLGAAGEDIEQLFAGWMLVESVRLTWLHVHPHH
jgi:hypothetical protein